MLPQFDSFTADKVWGLVLVSAIALTISGFLSPYIRTQLQSVKLILSVLIGSVLPSGLSAFLSDRYPSGTGYRTVFGYPRTFYSIWESFDNQEKTSAFNGFRFLENSLVYVAWISIILLIYWFIKLRFGHSRAR